ncbi:hypothetical protein DM01DRAFT_1333041 [Hesseltinella vesiculosa]|uniref:Uncharacterized protein n=1 Tax=Hesseltinella vesiculosa TaxID=101127 RepID=A0A1X2GR71_9FUNG|nr:hypothetical protein DM01DRAFT_1333041 [Hesseltinella vesiculosa]
MLHALLLPFLQSAQTQPPAPLSSSSHPPIDPTNLVSAITTMILDPASFRQSLLRRKDELQQQVHHINQLLSHSSEILTSIETVINRPEKDACHPLL